MKPQKRPYIVEIKHSRRSRKSPAKSIWGDVDLSAYHLSEVDWGTSSGKSEIAARITKELEAMSDDGTAPGTALNREPPAPSSVVIVRDSGFHYVQVFDNGAKYALIGPFRKRELAQGEAARWIARLQLESQQ